MNKSKMNANAIKANKRRIFKIDADVMTNKANAYISRSMIEENRLMILSNYSAAFMGNRQLANQNTDDIFRNRKAIISNIDTKSDVEVYYVESMLNQASIDYLEHRANLNTAVMDVNLLMAEVNSKLIEINSKIMASNESIVNFNSKNLSENSRLLKKGASASGANPPSNAKRIIKNKERLSKILKTAKGNHSKIAGLEKVAGRNRAAIEKNSSSIYSRRSNIDKNASIINQNQKKVSKLISG